MTWRVKLDERAVRSLARIDYAAQDDIRRYLRERIATDEDPRRFGEALRHNLRGLWRYRVESYRIKCRILDEEKVVFVLDIEHRRESYRQRR